MRKEKYAMALRSDKGACEDERSDVAQTEEGDIFYKIIKFYPSLEILTEHVKIYRSNIFELVGVELIQKKEGCGVVKNIVLREIPVE